MKTVREIFEALGSTAEFLFEPVTSLDQKGNSGDTPLHVVSSWGDIEAVDALIAAGADVNAVGEQGKTPLFSAVLGRSFDVVKRLLDSHADPTVRDQDGNTALQFALLLSMQDSSQYEKIIELLRR